MRFINILIASSFFVLAGLPALHLTPLNSHLRYASLVSASTQHEYPQATTLDQSQSTYRQQSALPVSGYAMYYNPNVMQEVLGNRLRMGHVSACPECVGNVALLRASDLNRRVWLQWADGTVEGPFLVADVAATQHVAQLLARNWVVDVDNRTAIRRRMAGPVPVTVWASPPSGSATNPTQPVAPTPAPTFTPYAILADTPIAHLPVVQAGFPTETPFPTITPLPALYGAPPAAVTGHQASFPADTPAPTITPLPAIYAAPQSADMQVKAVLPTVAPLATLPPTVTPVPAVTEVAQPPAAFPTDTPTPTITPLPALN